MQSGEIADDRRRAQQARRHAVERVDHAAQAASLEALAPSAFPDLNPSFGNTRNSIPCSCRQIRFPSSDRAVEIRAPPPDRGIDARRFPRRRKSPASLKSPARQTQQNSRLHQVDHHGRTAVADKRQHQALRRHQAHDHAHVNQRLQAEQHRQAERQILIEGFFDPSP